MTPDGLIAVTERIMKESSTSGAWFVFVRRSLRLIKILTLEGDGFSIWSKRLEQGRFHLPKDIEEGVRLGIRELQILLYGIQTKVFYKRYKN